jgi:hypothetical protein
MDTLQVRVKFEEIERAMEEHMRKEAAAQDARKLQLAELQTDNANFRSVNAALKEEQESLRAANSLLKEEKEAGLNHIKALERVIGGFQKELEEAKAKALDLPKLLRSVRESERYAVKLGDVDGFSLWVVLTISNSAPVYLINTGTWRHMGYNFVNTTMSNTLARCDYKADYTPFFHEIQRLRTTNAVLQEKLGPAEAGQTVVWTYGGTMGPVSQPK